MSFCPLGRNAEVKESSKEISERMYILCVWSFHGVKTRYKTPVRVSLYNILHDGAPPHMCMSFCKSSRWLWTPFHQYFEILPRPNWQFSSLKPRQKANTLCILWVDGDIRRSVSPGEEICCGMDILEGGKVSRMTKRNNNVYFHLTQKYNLRREKSKWHL